MNFGSNFNNRKLFTGEAKSTTNSVNMQRFNERQGVRSVDEVRMSRMKLKDQLNTNIYGPNEMKKLKSDSATFQAQSSQKDNLSRNEKKFNHIEAMRNIKRGI